MRGGEVDGIFRDSSGGGSSGGSEGIGDGSGGGRSASGGGSGCGDGKECMSVMEDDTLWPSALMPADEAVETGRHNSASSLHDRIKMRPNNPTPSTKPSIIKTVVMAICSKWRPPWRRIFPGNRL